MSTKARNEVERLVEFLDGVDPLRPGARADLAGSESDLEGLATAINAMLARVETERRESARRALRVHDDERRSLAQDLHDEIGQLLTAALLQLDHAEQHDHASSPAVREARRAVDRALGEVRRMSRQLRPLILDDLGLADALAALTASVGKRAGIEVGRELDLDALGRLSAEDELVIYRIARISLGAMLRSGSVRAAALRTSQHDDALALEIDAQVQTPATVLDDEVARELREIALLIGGDLEITSPAAGGVCVVLEVPRSRDGARRPL